MAANVLYWDIENSPLIVATWGLYDQTIPASHIIQESFIISLQWQWEGENEVHSIHSIGKDDTRVVRKAHALLSSADYAIAHNGDKHDWPHVLARMQDLGLPPINEPVFIDTLKMARKAKFPSRSLDYLTKRFCLPKKRETERGLWLDAAKGCKKAIKKITEYGEGDIPALIGLYKKISPYVKNKVNMGLYEDRPCCPSCGSESMAKRGFRITKTSRYQAWQCQGCGSWSQTTPRVKGAFFK